MLKQPAVSKKRKVEDRNVTAASRSAIPDELSTFESADKINSWNNFIDHLPSSNIMKDNGLFLTCDSEKRNITYAAEIC